MNLVFGTYLKKKRTERKWTLRGLAERVGVKHTYLNDIEKGNRPAPPREKLMLLASIFDIDKSKQDLYLYLDLAAVTRNTIPIDIEAFIRNNTELQSYLRKIINQDYLSNEDFENVLKNIKL